MPTAITIAAAAAQIGVDAAALNAAIADAVAEAERPTAAMCTLPGPALEVRAEIRGRLLLASRIDERSQEWRVRWL